jgi:hypothetical protein
VELPCGPDEVAAAAGRIIAWLEKGKSAVDAISVYLEDGFLVLPSTTKYLEADLDFYMADRSFPRREPKRITGVLVTLKDRGEGNMPWRYIPTVRTTSPLPAGKKGLLCVPVRTGDLPESVEWRPMP